MTEPLPELVWSSFLELPPEAVCIVYLDLNHWIYLAQAAVGKRLAAEQALAVCRAARVQGTACFVLSSTHYTEMQKIKDPAQRRAIADVMEELSSFSALLSRDIVMRYELHAALDTMTRTTWTLPRLSLIGHGSGHAFMGQSVSLKIMGLAGEVTDNVRQRYGPAFDSFVAAANLKLERSALRGPQDHEVDALRAHGYKPEASLNIGENRAIQEQAQRTRLNKDPVWRRGRLRDVISARELIIEFQDILPRALAERGFRSETIMRDQDTARWLVRAMPSTEVAIELKSAWHRNRDKTWTSNDIYDVDGLALAVPYCDIVVTEKACHHVLNSAGLGRRMHTALLRSLEDLPSALQSYAPKRISKSFTSDPASE